MTDLTPQTHATTVSTTTTPVVVPTAAQETATIDKFIENIVGGLMKNSTVSKLMACAMVVVGSLQTTPSGTINTSLTVGGIAAFIAHVLNPTGDAV